MERLVSYEDLRDKYLLGGQEEIRRILTQGEIGEYSSAIEGVKKQPQETIMEFINQKWEIIIGKDAIGEKADRAKAAIAMYLSAMLDRRDTMEEEEKERLEYGIEGVTMDKKVLKELHCRIATDREAFKNTMERRAKKNNNDRDDR